MINIILSIDLIWFDLIDTFCHFRSNAIYRGIFWKAKEREQRHSKVYANILVFLLFLVRLRLVPCSCCSCLCSSCSSRSSCSCFCSSCSTALNFGIPIFQNGTICEGKRKIPPYHFYEWFKNRIWKAGDSLAHRRNIKKKRKKKKRKKLV